MLKKVLSYFVPVNIYKRNSAISKSIEVTWANGELVLDSQNTNYSYGSLQRILRKGLRQIGFEKIAKMESILVLGVAGGSVIKTLVEEIQAKAKIIGVEIDAEVICLANKYFELDKIQNLEIIIDDAFDYVLKTTNKFDLIIVDVFRDTSMPGFLFEDFFVKKLCCLMQKRGFILFNTMILSDKDEKRNMEYRSQFDISKFGVATLPRLEAHNEVIIIEQFH